MRRMSFAKTTQQMHNRTKTVTRRHVDTWKHLKTGDRLMAIEKGQGLKKGERQVRVEPLHEITPNDIALEGFPGLSFWEFKENFPGPVNQLVRRIELKHLAPGAEIERAP